MGNKRRTIPKEIRDTLKDTIRILVRDGSYDVNSDNFLLSLHDMIQEVITEETSRKIKENFCEAVADAILNYMREAYKDIDEVYSYGDYLAIGEKWLETLDESMGEARNLIESGYTRVGSGKDFVSLDEEGHLIIKEWMID